MDPVLSALKRECAALEQGLAGVSEADLDRPTSCAPWTTKELLAHVCIGLRRLDEALDQVRTEPPNMTATEYYVAQRTEAADDNAVRIETAQQLAASWPTAEAALTAFAATWRAAVERAAGEGTDRTVAGRARGDWTPVFTLGEFLLTRVVEVTVHGRQLADALGRAPWSTVEGLAISDRTYA